MGFDMMDQVVRDAIAEALKVDRRIGSAVITTINIEGPESSGSDCFAAINFELEAENSHLKAENAKLNGEISELKSYNSQLKSENLTLHAENLQLRG